MLTDTGLGFEDTSVPYDELEDKVPYLCASFTGWRYKKMRLLNEWTKELDQDPPDALEMAKYEGYVRNRITDL
jgi:hypothetical protein